MKKAEETVASRKKDLSDFERTLAGAKKEVSSLKMEIKTASDRYVKML